MKLRTSQTTEFDDRASALRLSFQQSLSDGPGLGLLMERQAEELKKNIEERLKELTDGGNGNE